MAKSKGKPKTFWQYLLDEYILFRRDFIHEPQVAPEIVAAKLDTLDYENQDYWVRERRIQAHVSKVDNQWHFDLIAEQPVSRKQRNYYTSGYSPSANAKGLIYSDDDGKTLVEGTVVVNGQTFWIGVAVSFVAMMFFFGFVSMIGIPFEGFQFIALIYALGLGSLWFQMYQDRNHLANLVAQAIDSANERIYG